MNKLIWIRHGMTKGNEEKRYIGSRSDESLSTLGIQKLKENVVNQEYPACDVLYVSPMKRCQETAQIIYPKQPYQIVEAFKECDFGLFEGKNYKELSENIEYQRWLMSNGTMPFPMGESREQFKHRCVDAFLKLQASFIPNQTIGFVVHGGTIMAILSEFVKPSKDYFAFQLGNGDYYQTLVTKDEKLVLKEPVK